MSDLDSRISDILRLLEQEGTIGERFKGPTGRDEIRFGTHGSLSVIVRGPSRGNWFDHEQDIGGGPWQLIERAHQDVARWLRDHRLLDEPQRGDRIEAVYDYVDEAGNLLFQVVRRPGHNFTQRSPNGRGGWNEGKGAMKGVRRVLYHLPDLIAAKKTGNGHPWRVYLCAGEKDTDRLIRDWGVVATTNPGGEGNWRGEYDAYFAGAEIIMLEDNDKAGRDHTTKLAPRLTRAGASVRPIRLFHTTIINSKGEEVGDGKDISDWLDEGGSQSVLEEIIEGVEAFHLNGHDSQSSPVPLWNAVALDYWANRPIPAREWIMEDWVPRSQTTGLYGASGVLKTTWLLQLMMAASAGLFFCGRQITQVPVYGLFCEDTTEEIARRAARIAAFYDRDLSQFPNFHYASLVGIMDSELITFDKDGYVLGPAYELLQSHLASLHPGLVVLDTLPDFFGGSEINRRETSNFIRMLDSISMTHCCAVLAAAHPSVRGRASGRYDSGNTGIEGKMRARLSLHDPGEDILEEETAEERTHRVALNPTDKRILTRQNSNYAKPGETIELIIQEGAFFPAALDPAQAAKRGPVHDLAVRGKFKEILRTIIDEGGHVSDSIRSGPRNFAPRRFAPHTLNRATKYSSRDFQRAMDALLFDKEIRIDRNKRHVQIVFA